MHRGWVVGGEQVLEHLLANPLYIGFAEPHPDPAADHHRLGIEQVGGGGDPGPERLDRAVDQLRRKRVICMKRPLPDATGQAVAAALVHDLEQVRLRSGLVLAPGLGLHRRPAGVGLHASAPAAGALGAALLHHHVADLAGRPAPKPGPVVDHDPAADTGSPEHPEKRPVGTARAQLRLRRRGDLDVVPHRHRRAEGLGQPGTERKASLPAREVAGLGHRAAALVHLAGRAHPDPEQGGGIDPGVAGRLGHRLRHLGGHVLGPTCGGSGPASLGDHLPAAVDGGGLNLGSAEVDAAPNLPCAHRHLRCRARHASGECSLATV
jgi:hypothetical protein